ncbi:hypothetical protein DSO57_1027455 [Entomophthora muscae]|uniref:Uncharacterized protein n=1 Tax=Entomophthora muscae TaxID=34485 RepID=A0ACC2RSY5_9FUNG|nr:hypothetical protein DSO57_1027455 [Entomophthora muscae]
MIGGQQPKPQTRLWWAKLGHSTGRDNFGACPYSTPILDEKMVKGSALKPEHRDQAHQIERQAAASQISTLKIRSSIVSQTMVSHIKNNLSAGAFLNAQRYINHRKPRYSTAMGTLKRFAGIQICNRNGVNQEHQGCPEL